MLYWFLSLAPVHKSIKFNNSVWFRCLPECPLSGSFMKTNNLLAFNCGNTTGGLSAWSAQRLSLAWKPVSGHKPLNQFNPKSSAYSNMPFWDQSWKPIIYRRCGQNWWLICHILMGAIFKMLYCFLAKYKRLNLFESGLHLNPSKQLIRPLSKREHYS